jgi:multiple sugar transport system substrate-binding protein
VPPPIPAPMSPRTTSAPQDAARERGPGRRRLRRTAGAATLLLSASLLAACGSSSSASKTLTWYINPDSGGQAEIAKRCTQASNGAYSIQTSQLPRESSDQRQQLVRRLAAKDASIDLMSLDPPYVPEFAQAKFLAPVPQDVGQRVTQGVFKVAVTASTWDDQLVAVPFWANTQLLWYKKSVAQQAGLDLSQPVTWQQLVEAAQKTKKDLAVQGIRAEALTVWVNALVASAGGEVITDAAAKPQDVKLGLADEPAKEAAQVIQSIVKAGVAGPAFSTAGEDANSNAFEAGSAAFMVNWPFVWPKATTGVEAGTLKADVQEDYGWALYPEVKAGEQSRPPFGGIVLGVGAFSKHQDLAFQASECITSEANQSYYFTSNGNPAVRTSVYDDPEVVKQFPMAPLIRQSLEQAATRPQTPYYSEVSSSIQREFSPPSAVGPNTGTKAAELIKAVLDKKELL